MIIISDASPIITLYNAGHLNLLQEVYGKIVITDIVNAEVELSLPNWIEVTADYEKNTYRSLCLQLDEGEASAIALATSVPTPTTLIIDERLGRRVAKELGLDIIGLMGVIVKAKKLGIIAAGLPIIKQFQENGFRISDTILSIVREKLGE